MSTTITSKGQVTIPKAVRDQLGLKPGSKVTFVRGSDGRYVIEKEGPSSVKPPSRFALARGAAGPGPSTDEIMALLRGDFE